MSTTYGLIQALATSFHSPAQRRSPCLVQATSVAMRERRRLEIERRQRNLLRLWAFTVSSA